MGIKTKFLLVLLPLFLLSFAVFSTISYNLCNEALIKNADENARAISNEAAISVEKYIVDKTVRMQDLSLNPSIVNGDHAAKLAALKSAKDSSNDLAMTAFVGTDGKGFSHKDEAVDRGGRDYFKYVMQTGNPCMTGTMISGTTKQLITLFAYPVKNDGGALLGLIYGTVNLGTLSEMVGEFKFMQTGYVYIIDEDGLCIAYKQHPEYVGKLNLSTPEGDVKLDQRLLDGRERERGEQSEPLRIFLDDVGAVFIDLARELDGFLIVAEVRVRRCQRQERALDVEVAHHLEVGVERPLRRGQSV